MALELSIPKSELTRLLNFTQSIGQKKTTMPILVNVLLSASEKELRVSATDLELAVTVKAQAQVKTPGSTTVNAKVFSDVVRELPESDVHIRVGEGERIDISCQKSKIRLVGVSADEYPALPGLSLEVDGRIPAPQLLDMVAKTVYAVSMDETRFNLTGVCFQTTQSGSGKKAVQTLRLVATDGHRLAMVSRPMEAGGFTGSCIVPRRGLLEVRRVLEAEGEKSVRFDVKNGFFIVETDSSKIAARLIDGEFPDYNQVIPKDKGTIAQLSSGVLAQALRRVALMVTDKSKGVRLDFAPGSLRISSSSPELGEASEEVDVEYTGSQVSIGFNAKYLLDVASSLSEDQRIQIELHGDVGPGRFMPEGDDSYVSIVMPMRL